MSRFIVAPSIGLALAIALVAGMVGWRLMTFSSPTPASGVADPAVGHAFYAGINDVLSGKDVNALDDIVASDFVDHTNKGSAGDLTDQLATFRTSFPGTQVQVLDIEPSANGLVVSLAPLALPPVQVAQLTLSAQPFDGGYEVLRIRNGKVSERWSQGLPALSATTFPDASLATSGGASMAIRLDRTELPVGAELNWNTGRSSVLLVEAGSLTVRLIWNEERALESQLVTVEAGTALPISSYMKVRVQPDSSGPATLLIFSLRRVTPTDVPSPSHSQGATSRLLWTSNLPVSLDSGWTLGFGRVLLSKNAEVTLSGEVAMEMLLCPETNAVRVVAATGSIESLNADRTTIDRANVAVVGSGNAAHAVGIESLELRAVPDPAEAPATDTALWLITISPAKTTATPVA